MKTEVVSIVIAGVVTFLLIVGSAVLLGAFTEILGGLI